MAGIIEPMDGAAVAMGLTGASKAEAASFRASAARRRIAGADAIADISDFLKLDCLFLFVLSNYLLAGCLVSIF
jgi:hypothetical protein